MKDSAEIPATRFRLLQQMPTRAGRLNFRSWLIVVLKLGIVPVGGSPACSVDSVPA